LTGCRRCRSIATILLASGESKEAPVILVEAVLGNVRDPDWKARVERAAVDPLTLDQWEAQKNRFRKHTDGGLELAVALDRRTHLKDGDVLVWDEAAGRIVVAHIHLNDVMVVRLTDALGQPADLLVRTCLELGHALGNQHWPAVVKGTEVYVPLTVDRKVMASVMKTHALPGVTYDFVPGADVIPYLAPHEARRLFGGADATPHSHTGDHHH
jgi:urease accessory protein